MTLSDFIEELNIAIRQDGHDIYCNASTAKIIKRYLTKQKEGQKKGEWIKVMEGNAYRDKCNQCGRLYPNAYGYNFCPNCGADMRKREGNNI